MSQLVDYFNRITSKDPPEPPEPKQNNPPNSKLADYFDRITSKDPPESTEPKQNYPPNLSIILIASFQKIRLHKTTLPLQMILSLCLKKQTGL